MEANLKINADTAEGRRNVAQLAESFESLSKTLGGEVGAQAQAAATKLRELGQQQEAIQNFQALRTEVSTTQRDLKDLEREAGAYAKQITAAGPPTAQEAEHLAKLREAADDAAKTLGDQKSALAESTAELQRHGIASDSANKALARVRSEITSTTQETTKLDPRLAEVAEGLKKTATVAKQAEDGLAALEQELRRKNEAIQAGLQYERSAQELQSKHLQLQNQEQQGYLKAAQARGDEAAATKAQNALREIEANQLRLVAQAKRAEAAAIDQTTQATREEMAARGPLNQAQMQAIAASENHAKALRAEAAAADQAALNVATLGKESGAAAGQVENLGKIGDGLKSKLTGVAAAVTGLFAAAQLKDFAQGAIETADAYGQMAERIKMATPIAAEYNTVQKRILEAANLTYRPLKEQQTLYIETADALRELGYTTTQALDIQDSFTYLLTTNAATVEKGQNAIDAYTKSINSGRIEVDAWQSLLAATPTIIDAVAAATGKTTGEVRQLGITGKLSIADLNEGLRLSVDRNKQLAAGMSTTVKDAVQRLSNTWQTYIGEANKATQSTSQIVKMVDLLSANLDGVVKAATVAGEVMVAVWAFKALGALKSYVAQLRVAAVETTTLMSTTATAGAKMAAALSAAGKLAAAGWIGWEIGTFLRTEFEVVEKAGIALSAQLTKGAALVQGAWEMAQAAFSSDTVDAAMARTEQRLQEIDAIYAEMFANAGKTAQAQDALAASTTGSGTAAENAKTKWEQYKSAFTTASEKLEQQRQQVEAMVSLRNAEADGIARIAQEMGTEREARQAAADAAAVQAEQAKLQAEQASIELAAVRAHRDELAALGAEILKNDPIRQKELDALNTEVAVRESAAGQAIAHARALEVAAVAAKGDAAAVADNSGRVKELGEEYQQARFDLELLRNLQAAGIKTQADVAAAENAMVKASKEYKDALKDQEELIRARNSAEQSSFDLKSASINLAIEQQRSILAVAKATGNEAMEMQAENEIRRLQIELLVLTAKAKDAEATAALASIEVKRAELVASGQLTEAKRLELDAATQAAKVKQMEAKIARETANGLERLGQVRKGSKSDIDNEADALERLNGERERELGNMVKRDNMGHETRTAGTSTGNRQGIIEWLKGAGLDEAVAEYISRDFVDANGDTPYMNNVGQKKWNGSTITNALSNAVDYFKYGDGKVMAEQLAANAKAEKDAKEKKNSATTEPTSTTSSSGGNKSSGGSSSGNSYVTQINVPGKQTRLNWADAQSKSAGEQLITDLLSGKGVSQ